MNTNGLIIPIAVIALMNIVSGTSDTVVYAEFMMLGVNAVLRMVKVVGLDRAGVS